MRWLLVALALGIGTAHSQDKSPADDVFKNKAHPNKAEKKAKPDKQGTEKNPLVIKRYDAEETPERRDQLRAEREEKSAEEKRLILWTIVLAGATIGLVGVAGAQLGMFWIQLKLMRKVVADGSVAANAAKASADAAIRIQLPVLRAIPADLMQLKEPIPIDGGGYGGGDVGLFPTRYSGISYLKFNNHGRSEAFPITLSTGWKIAEKLPDTPAYDHDKVIPHASVIKPGEEFSIDLHRTIELSEAEILEIKTEKSWLWFYGSLRYCDFMGDERDAPFCWRWARRHPADISAYFASDGDPPPAYTKQT